MQRVERKLCNYWNWGFQIQTQAVPNASMLPKLMTVMKFRTHKSNMQKLSVHFIFCGGPNSYVLLLRLENCLTRESSFLHITDYQTEEFYAPISCATFLYYYMLYISCQRKINQIFLKHLGFLRANMIKNPNSAFFSPVLSLHTSRVGHMNTGDAAGCGDNKRNWEQDKLKWNFRKQPGLFSKFPKTEGKIVSKFQAAFGQ